jgi:hypothetical protein
MAFFVKVIPPSRRARIHYGECDHCREGQGQDQGVGPSYWKPGHPEPGFQTLEEALTFMNGLGPRFTDTGLCADCMKDPASA